MTLKEKSNKVEAKLEDQLEQAQADIKDLRRSKEKAKEKNATLKEKYKSFKKAAEDKDEQIALLQKQVKRNIKVMEEGQQEFNLMRQQFETHISDLKTQSEQRIDKLMK